MNNIEKIFRTIEQHKEYLFVAWPLVNGQFGIDVLDYEHEERLDGGIFDNVDQAIEWLNENYVR
ncbi:hypothetical protein WFbE185_00227 [Escherichia phage vB_EcoM_WFbE185]|uniref:Uncharacterized protein n=1 Tax=Escherichia phage vB_EcoM_WFbE185 TaxID=2508199 RepID=A0A482MXJ6_9CAUD|nr:hypothetical protein WFbE185_00227 [Escherichia phage vB_EcoM_WFbE185]